jgi:hypothetical protein
VRALLIPIAVVCLCAGAAATAHAQQDDAPRTTSESDQERGSADRNATREPSPRASAPDSRLIAAGEAAFSSSCTTCHDANRALSKSKTVAQWRSTVQRMAGKVGADIAAGDIEAIAAYLASQSSSAGGTTDSGELAGYLASGTNQPSTTIYGTFSPTWRGGNDNLQNPGFFPDTWVGVDFQSGSAMSGRVTSCITCHNEPGFGSRVEIVEAALRIDLGKALDCCDPQWKSSIEAGRFIVPFGAFAQQSNPGIYRTVTKPIMYNMGMRVLDPTLGNPVLPMPYADEGANLHLSVPLWSDVAANWDAYVVNGLWASPDGIDFYLSRNYVDNNTRPAAGTRVTVGNSLLRLGGSVMAGDAAPTGGFGPGINDLYYRIYGFDAVFRYEDIFRFQAEYARRDSDRVVNLLGPPTISRDHIEGYYIESELLLSRILQMSFLARYDRQGRNSVVPPFGSNLPGSFAVSRMTYGFNFVLPGGSLLMLDVERWNLPGALPRLDLLGVRWAFSF